VPDGRDQNPATIHQAIGRRSFRQPAASGPTTWALGYLIPAPEQNPSTIHEAIGRRSFWQPAVSSPTTWAGTKYSTAATSPPSTTCVGNALDGLDEAAFDHVRPDQILHGLEEGAFAHVGPDRLPDGPDQNPSTPREALGRRSFRQPRHLFPDHAGWGSSFVLLRTGRDRRVPRRNSAALERPRRTTSTWPQWASVRRHNVHDVQLRGRPFKPLYPTDRGRPLQLQRPVGQRHRL